MKTKFYINMQIVRRKLPIISPRRPKSRRPNFFIFLPRPKAAVSPMGADDAAPPEDEGNPAKGGCFTSIYITRESTYNLSFKINGNF